MELIYEEVSKGMIATKIVMEMLGASGWLQDSSLFALTGQMSSWKFDGMTSKRFQIRSICKNDFSEDKNLQTLYI